MTREREAIAERLRAALAGAREVRMFGALSFMVDDALVVAAQKDGGLLVRVDPARHDELTAIDGAGQAEMGTGRTMGPGWIAVDPDAVATESQLSWWLGVALEHHAAVTGQT